MVDAANRRVTVDVLDTIPEEERAEVIDGVVVYETMTGFPHGQAQLALGAEILSRFGGGGPSGRDAWRIATAVTVVYATDQGFRHDAVGWRKDRVPQRPTERKVTLRPDWVCEILSTNRRKDLVQKRRVLHAHAVPHYWILDPDALELSVLRWHADAYLLISTVSPGESARLEPFDAVELDVTRLFGDIPTPPAGGS